jgi:hypothetical protein
VEDARTGETSWEFSSLGWEAADDELRAAWQGDGFAVSQAPALFRDLTCRVELVPERSLGTGWKVAGLVVYQDTGNFWHLALVEGPDEDGAEHFIELSEMREGQWLAHLNLEATDGNSTRYDWEYGKAYTLELRLWPDGVSGVVRTADDGRECARLGFRFSAEAVTYGRGALRSSSLPAVFRAFTQEGRMDTSVPIPADETVFPEYAVSGSGLVSGREGTGFFTVALIGGRWWAVDPRGELFYAVGTDHVNYHVHYCQELGYAPYHRNCEERYGSADVWAGHAVARLLDWGFNLLGANNSPETRHQGLSHTLFASFGASFSPHSALVEKTTWTGFPNVFAPDWETFCRIQARALCAPNRRDPWLFGYFLDNELEWYGKAHTEFGIFTDTLRWPADHSGKQALCALLREQAGDDLNRFNADWGTALTSWSELAELEALEPRTEVAVRARTAFLELVAERYFAATTAAIREQDPNHLILGSRFAGDAPVWAWEACARHCDIVSFNHYPTIDFESGDLSDLGQVFREYYQRCQRPLMITEWSFPALDAGLPSTKGAGMRVDTQAQKSACFEVMQHLLFRLPFLVGSDYFMWADEPELGISDTFPENSNYGLVNVHDQAYPALTQACAELNPQAAALHAGLVPEVYVDRVRAEGDRVSATLVNHSPIAVSAEVVFSAGAQTPRARTVEVPAAGVAETSGLCEVPAETRVTARLPVEDTADLAVRVRVAGRSPHGCRGLRERIALRSGVSTDATAPDVLARAPVLVANPTATDLVDVPLFLALPDGLPEGRVRFAGERTVHCLRAAPRSVALLVPELRAGESVSGYLLLTDSETGPTTTVGFEPVGAHGFRVTNNRLLLEHSGGVGDVVERVTLLDPETGDTMLGRYNPLVWQDPGQEQWVQATRTVRVENERLGRALRLRVTAEGGVDAGGLVTEVDDQGRATPLAATPVPFRVTHELLVWPGVPWFAARAVAVENLSNERELVCKGLFFYLQSAIGGDPDQDVPGIGEVPQYYLTALRGSWVDPQLGVRYGCLPDDDRVAVNFWLDEGGGQHPDARVVLEPPERLAPVERHELESPPWIVVYGGGDDGPEAPLNRLLRTRHKVIVTHGDWEPVR